jgi:RNA polymerase-binding transcription factor DksA
MGRKLTPEDVDRYRAILDHMRRVVVGDIDGLEADAFPEYGERPPIDNPAGAGSDTNAQEFSLELLQRDEEALGEIIDALERVGDGSFGRCATCDEWIPKTRLSAVPYTRNCVACQRALEQAR